MLPEKTPVDRERALNLRLLDGGLYLTTSETFKGEENGWFRITFAVERSTLEIGLKRFGLYSEKLMCRLVDIVGAREKEDEVKKDCGEKVEKSVLASILC